MAPRPITTQAFMYTSRILKGIAHCSLPDGRAAIVQRLDDGTWRHVLAGTSTPGFADSGAAVGALQSILRAEGVLLRLRG